MVLVVPCQRHGKGETAGEREGRGRGGAEGSLGCGPYGPPSSAPYGRQGLGSATSKRCGSVFKLSLDAGEGDPRLESP